MSVYLLEFVWRQSEFAFFGALTAVDALFIFIFRRKNMKKLIMLSLMLVTALTILTACSDEPSENPPVKTSYTITWVNENGEVISADSVAEGKTPSRSYSVTDTQEWDYTFEGWAESADGAALSTIPAAAKNATYYARVSAIKKKYTVTYNSCGGNAIPSQTVEYGSKATIPEEPTLEQHRFMGWSSSPDSYVAVDFDAPITENIELFAVWNEIVNVKELLATLLNGYKLNPFSLIPESMRSDFSANLVDPDDIPSDYSDFVSVSDINYGFGEQWHMILSNLEQSSLFFDALAVVDGLTTASLSAFNNYFDSNPADTAHHEFEHGSYNITVNFDGETISYVLDYTTTLPVLGEQTAQIALSMNAETSEKVARIQLGDANALTYKIFEDSYEFAIQYLGTRRAMFSIEENDDGTVSGKIYEFLTVSSVELSSAADFYITEDYVVAVGNKASGMAGATNYICELYSAETGRMIGYEVQESVSILSFDVTFNTPWFNLCDVSGITSVKCLENGSKAPSFYINGSTSPWEVKLIGGFDIKRESRRFDIEFRTQYVYSFDAASGKYTEHAVSVPMLFVQEECMEDLSDDIRAANGINVSVNISSSDMEKLVSDYHEKIPVFVEHKEEITADTIIGYIGNKIVFNEEN